MTSRLETSPPPAQHSGAARVIRPQCGTRTRSGGIFAANFCTIRALLLGTAVLAAVIAHGGSLAAQSAVDTSELAQSARQANEVIIESDSMEVLDQQKRAIFTGDVDAQRGDITFKTDRMVADYKDSGSKEGEPGTEVTFLEGTGAVVIQTPRQRITGSWAKMDVKANQITVGGSVVVTQGNTVLRGERLFLDLDKDTSELTGGRVRGRFVPSQ